MYQCTSKEITLTKCVDDTHNRNHLVPVQRLSLQLTLTNVPMAPITVMTQILGVSTLREATDVNASRVMKGVMKSEVDLCAPTSTNVKMEVAITTAITVMKEQHARIQKAASIAHVQRVGVVMVPFVGLRVRQHHPAFHRQSSHHLRRREHQLSNQLQASLRCLRRLLRQVALRSLLQARRRSNQHLPAQHRHPLPHQLTAQYNSIVSH